ncbi:FAS1-like dehydratase domain-containing protein [Paracoccus sp. NSM]|uniref:FAS1-like dehydratase domain-containing protein n=1 Tax=Paracoccus sp. NSM TaxID=3457784 RepID=UPI004036E03F
MEIDHLRDWIGRSEERAETLTGGLVARFLATFGREGPVEDGAEAPPLIHLCLTQPALPAGALGPDGHPARGGFLPPVPLPRRMWAGGRFALHAPLRIGDRVTRRSRITDVQLKQGGSGPLCFVTLTHEISGPDGLSVTERQDIVYRDAGGGASSPPPAPTGETTRPLPHDPTTLFRYSALTFNGHRIHYDAPYARQVEGYPGLVVHGPLQATALLHLAQDLGGRIPAIFSFRSLTPLFAGDQTLLHAAPDGDGLRLWTARQGGPVATEARASW